MFHLLRVQEIVRIPAASCGEDLGRNGAGHLLQGPAGILAAHHEPSTSGGVPVLPDNQWQQEVAQTIRQNTLPVP